ncbi:hypothetical protein [Prosthecobacter sp.]|uniref:hypothetical protein n=1 Tax=Prosthecobacter sp. TaxID=1965333 RepID=UPI0037852F93
MKKSPQCPLCFSSLERREVAPCMDCGHCPEELQHLREGIHQYAECEAFGKLSVILCNFCAVDFGSHVPAYFGVSPRKWNTASRLNFLRAIYPSAEHTWDAVCPECQRRCAWLDFVQAARQLNDPQSEYA